MVIFGDWLRDGGCVCRRSTVGARCHQTVTNKVRWQNTSGCDSTGSGTVAKSSGAMETLETVDMKHSSGQMVSYLIVNVYLAVVVDWIK